jgi:uncharacterized membrane protein
MRITYRLLLFFILALWCFGIFIELFVPYEENLLFAVPFLKKSYSLVCHQQASKLIPFEHGESLACARCTGIYLGLLLSSFISLFYFKMAKPGIKYLFISAVPMTADVILYSLNVYPYLKISAFVTGLLLGSTGFLYLYAGLKNLLAEKNS